MKIHSCFFLFLTTICVVHTLSLFAAADDKNKAAAQSFKRGTELFRAKNYLEASREFRRANELRPNWKILYNIGQSDAAAKRYGMALESFETYLSMAGDNISVERKDAVLQEIDRLRRMVGDIEIEGAPDKAIVKIDDVVRGETPLAGPIMIAAGVVHTLVVTKDDRVLLNQDLKLPSGRSKIVEIEAPHAEEPLEDETQMKPVSDAEPPKKETVENEVIENERDVENSNPTGLKLGGWSTFGVGAATLVGSGVTFGLAIALDRDLAPECEPNGCPSNLEEDYNRLEMLKLTSFILVGTGAALTVTGTALVILAKIKKKKSEADVSLLPSVGPNFAGFVLAGEF